MNLSRKFILFITLVPVLAGCQKQDFYQRTFPLMGTVVTIKVPHTIDSKKIVEKAISRMEELTAIFDRFNKRSEVYKINTSGNASASGLSPELKDLLDLSSHLKRIAGGAFDVTAADGSGLDFGATAKGYIVDEAAKVLRENGIKSALLDAGGDMFCIGDKKGVAWIVGIRDPRDKIGIIAKIKIKDKALATSGQYEQKRPHIIDPRTGRPPENSILSVTVISESCALADGLATALFVLNPQEGLSLVDNLEGVDCVIISEDSGKVRFSISFDTPYGIEIL